MCIFLELKQRLWQVHYQSLSETDWRLIESGPHVDKLTAVVPHYHPTLSYVPSRPYLRGKNTASRGIINVLVKRRLLGLWKLLIHAFVVSKTLLSQFYLRPFNVASEWSPCIGWLFLDKPSRHVVHSWWEGETSQTVALNDRRVFPYADLSLCQDSRTSFQCGQ